MADYTKLTEKKASEILELYGLGEAEELTPLSLGISNSNYKVKSASKYYLLKVSNDKNKTELQQEQDILNIIKEYGYPYSLKPYKCLKGKNVYEHDQFIGVLFPFIDGIPPGPADTTCFEIGAALATLHALNTQEQKDKIRYYNDIGYGVDELLAYVDSDNPEKVFVEKFNHVFPDKLESFCAKQFPSGIIHGDLYYDNTLFFYYHLHTVLDFEQSGWGDYIFDIGVSISGTCLEKGRVITPLIHSYLKGYESIRPFTTQEKEHLHEAILLGLFSISLWRIRRFTEGDLNPLMADSYQELLYRAQAFKDSFESGLFV